VNLVELAQRLKRLRTERGLTLEDVASRAGLTRGWLSKVENFRLTPSLPALSAIAGALGVPMAELFDGIEGRPPLVITKRGQGQVTRRDEDVSTLTYESLAFRRPSRQMDPFVLTVPPNDTRPPLSHGGEEFLIVLDGRVALDYAEDRHTLEPGDSAYFDPHTPHRLVCLSDAPSRVLVVFSGIAEDRAVDAGDTTGDAR
jgi:transcriptional regulator with XRE-family HTH domain